VSVSEPVVPGDVLELDPDNPSHYRKSRGPCSNLVAGVVSTDPGFVLGSEVQDSTDGVSVLSPESLASGFDGWAVAAELVTPDSWLRAPISSR